MAEIAERAAGVKRRGDIASAMEKGGRAVLEGAEIVGEVAKGSPTGMIRSFLRLFESISGKTDKIQALRKLLDEMEKTIK